MAGTCHAPKFIDETISQAIAAVSRACTILSKNTYQEEAAIACVNEDICSGCGICKTVCSYNATGIVTEGEKQDKGDRCPMQRVRACAEACLSGAIEQKGFKSTQLLAMDDAAPVNSFQYGFGILGIVHSIPWPPFIIKTSLKDLPCHKPSREFVVSCVVRLSQV